MNIAVFHELNKGGARRAVNEFSGYLKRKNIVDLYLVDDKKNIKEEKNFNKVFFYKFIPKKWNGNNWKTKLYKDTIELVRLYNLHKKIAKSINFKKYDLVFIHGSKFTQAPFLLRLVKHKKVYYCQEPLRIAYENILDLTKNLDLKRRIYERLNRLIRKKIDKSNALKADMILANSRYTKKFIYSAFKINARVCYMGVDEKTFYPQKCKKTADILFIGAYEFVDGYDLLKETLKLFKKKINVKILASEVSWIDNDNDLRKLYSSSKIALCLAYNEPFGLIPLEAMACGTPVIAVNEAGYKESVVDNTSGFLIKRDSRSLKEKISKLLTNKNLLLKIKSNSRRYIEDQWTWNKKSLILEKTLRDFLKK